MLLRTLLHLLRSRMGRRLPVSGVARTRFRVLPTDLDVLRHMNNGVYFSIADIARFDLLTRNGVAAVFAAQGWYPVVANETITFRKSLMPWQRFVVESRILGFDERAVYVEQRFVVAGQIFARVHIRGRILRRSGGTVPMAEVQDAVGLSAAERARMVVAPWLLAWGDTVALPSTHAEAPSRWTR